MDFFLKYIFSQALLPSIVQIAFLLNSRRISIVCLIPNLYYSELENVMMKRSQIYLFKISTVSTLIQILKLF